MKRFVFCAVVFLLLSVVSAGVASADCRDARLACVKIESGKIYARNAKGMIVVGQCWKDWKCQYCDTFTTIIAKCNSQFATCEGNCAVCIVDSVGQVFPPCYNKNGTQVPW